MPPRRIMKEFSILEISGVDDPAQAPALMSIMKAKGFGTNAGEPGDGQSKEDAMSKTAEELQAELTKQAALTKAAEDRAAAAEAIAKMSDADKAAMADMDEAEKAKFVAAKPEDREKEVAKRREANPVIYKSKSTGAEYRKSDDARLVDLAKRDDEREAELTKMRNDSINATFEKRASTEFAKFKGDLGVKTALVKAVAGIQDEALRNGVNELLKSAHNALGVMLKEVGTGADDTSGDDADQDLKKSSELSLDKMAKDYMAKNSGTTFAKAYDAVLSTPEGAKLYAKSAG
jgi:hypothetical protein